MSLGCLTATSVIRCGRLFGREDARVGCNRARTTQHLYYCGENILDTIQPPRKKTVITREISQSHPVNIAVLWTLYISLLLNTYSKIKSYFVCVHDSFHSIHYNDCIGSICGKESSKVRKVFLFGQVERNAEAAAAVV